MAEDRSPTHLRGFIAPMQDFTSANHWTAESVMTQGTGRAGVPVAQQSSALVVTARGQQAKDIDIKTESAGNIADGCGFKWKNTTDTNYLGGDVPTVIGDYRVLFSSALEAYKPRDAVKTPTGEILVAVEKTGVTNNTIFVLQIAIDGTTSSVTLDTAAISTLSGESRYPELCLMPDDSVLCFYWVANNTEELANIEVQRSTDNGATWTLVSKRALPDDIDIQSTFGSGASGNALGRIQVAASSSQVLMFCNLVTHDTSKSKPNYVQQYASTASGLKFSFVDQTSTSGSDYFHHQCLVSWDDAFIMSWVVATDNIGVTRLSSAFESVVNLLSVDSEDLVQTTGAVADNTPGYLVDTVMDMWLDPSGRLYLAWGSSPGGATIHGAYSDLAGVAFENWGKDWHFFGREPAEANALADSQMINLKPPSAAAASGLNRIVGISTGGSQSIFCNWISGGASAYEDSLLEYKMGGWATVNMPATARYPEDKNRAYQDLVWIPADLPAQASVWTKALTGSATETLTTLLRLSAAATEGLYYKRSLTSKTGGLIVRAQMSGISGGNAVLAIGNGIEMQMQE